MSRVFIVGGSGFIGRHIAGRLAAAGHEVRAEGRNGVNLARDDVWTMCSRVHGFDVVINCAGLVRSIDGNTMAAVHGDGAARLFQAAIDAGVSRFVHISALGVAATGKTEYQATKAIAEAAFLQLDANGEKIDWRVLRPSVVIGRGGASTAWLLASAALPLTPVFGDSWRFQPIHVDDVAELVARLVSGAASPRRIDVVGPAPMNMRQTIAALRAWLLLPPSPVIAVPESVVRLAATLGERFIDGPLNRGVIDMLSHGNVADAGPMTAALGRPPRVLADALALRPASDADRQAARLFFVRPLLRWSIGVFWILTAVMSFGLYPLEKSYEMLAQIGLAGVPAHLALFSGAALDLVLGVLLLMRCRPVLVGVAQLLSVGAFTVLAMWLPADYWLHPFAPILKNLPIAAALLVMIALEA